MVDKELLLRFMVSDEMLGKEIVKLECAGYIDLKDELKNGTHVGDWLVINNYKITEKGLKKIGKV